jgi:methionine-R-sulfoxide reductase
MTRIAHPSSRSSHITMIFGLVLALLVIVGVVWYTQRQAGKVVERTHPDEFPVPSDRELQMSLSPEQYTVTRRNGTETAFRNAYWDNYKPGIYVDVITNEPLFSSLDKYDSKTGWPSFTKPIAPGHVVEKPDTSFNMVRTEIRAKKSDSHLGYLFDDGPPPTNKRYFANSAALRFVPAETLKAEGFLEFLPLFELAPTPTPAMQESK